MPFRAAALLVAFAGTFAAARADDTAARWKYDNPFCQVVAFTAPLPDVVAPVALAGGESRYALGLYTAAGATLSAHVTLVSDTNAYDAAVPEGTLFGAAGDRKSDAIVVTLPAPDRITPPPLRGDLKSPIGDYGSKPLAVTARAYIDSNGYSIREEIVHQFTPAQFLCVPVVGVTDVELEYNP